MTNEVIQYHCPKCDGILTPWINNHHVCDVCGYGHINVEEYNELQDTKKEKLN